MSKSITINLITIVFIVFIGFIIFSANSGTNLIFFRLLKNIPMSDKVAHLCLVGTLAFLINLSLKNRTLYVFQSTFLLGSAIVFCFITVEEFSQLWLAKRSFDLLDLTSNYMGIFIASVLNKKIIKLGHESK